MAEKTAAEWREEAAAAEQARADSWERSDTDGFLSQWANGITAQKARRQAEIVEAGGMARFAALFDAVTGEIVPAKLIRTRYGEAWGLLEGDDPEGRFVGFFNESGARKAATRIANNAKKGYRVGYVMAPAVADIGGSGTGLAGAASCYVYTRRTDGGFARLPEVEGEPEQDW